MVQNMTYIVNEYNKSLRFFPDCEVENVTENVIDHFQINVSDIQRSMLFYRDMLGRLGFVKVLEMQNMVQWEKGGSRVILVQSPKRFGGNRFHRKHVGLNHIAFRAPSREAVDKFNREFLLANKVPVLYGGLREWPEYEAGYYAVYFEDPDRIKLELVHTLGKGSA